MDINIIIKSDFVRKSDQDDLFGDEKVIYIENPETLQDLCVKLGTYKSKSQARKAGRIGDIKTGYTEYKSSKKVFLFIWNPSE